MSITILDSERITFQTTGPFALTATGSTAGALLIAVVNLQGSHVLAGEPTGWTLVNEVASSSSSRVKQIVYAREATGNSSDDFSVSSTSATFFSGGIVQITGLNSIPADLTTLSFVEAHLGATHAQQITVPSITTAVDNSVLLLLVSGYDSTASNTVTLGGSFTEVLDLGQAAAGTTFAAGHRTHATAGATSTHNVTHDAVEDANWGLTLINLGPEAAASFTAGTLSESSKTDTTATLAWTSSTNGTGSVSEQLQISPNGAGTWTNVSGATSSPATDSGLSALTAYDYRVAYTDTTPTTVYSNTVTVTTTQNGTLAFYDDLDSYANTTEMSAAGWDRNGSLTTDTAYTGSQAYNVNAASTTLGRSFTAATEVTAGMQWHLISGAMADTPIIRHAIDITSYQCELWALADGSLQVRLGTTAIATSSAAGWINVNTTYRVEFRLKCDDTVGEFDAWVDGQLVAWTESNRNVDTKFNSGTANVSYFRAPSNSGSDRIVDDIYVWTGTNEGSRYTVSGWDLPIDETAPTLSSPTATATSDTTADLSVTTDEDNGTLYSVLTGPLDPHRYWRINVTAGQGGNVFVTELEFRATEGGADQATGGTAIGNFGSPITYAFDDNDATHATEGNADLPQWSGYDFGTVVSVKQVAIRIAGVSTASTVRDFTIDFSDDGTNWTTVATYSGTTWSATTQTQTFAVPTTPSIAQIKAGQNSSGSAAAWSDSQAISTTGAKTFNATGLTAETTYTAYFIHEDTSSNQSSISNTSPFTTDAIPTDETAPAVPTSFAVTPGNTQNVLVWIDPDDSDLAGINIYRGTVSGTLSLHDTVAAGTETYTDTGLTNGTEYFYRISAFDEVPNISAQTSEVSATPSGIPTAASNLVLSPRGWTRVELTWDDNSSDETGFKIQQSADGSTGWSTIHTTAADVTSYIVPGLTQGTIYYFRVIATNATGDSSPTAVVNGTPNAFTTWTATATNGTVTPSTGQISDAAPTDPIEYTAPASAGSDTLTISYDDGEVDDTATITVSDASDVTEPTGSAVFGNDGAVITFSEEMNAATFSESGHSYKIGSTSFNFTDSVLAANGLSATLNYDAVPLAGQTVTWSYDRSAGTTTDLAGNELVAYTDEPATNSTSEGVVKLWLWGQVDGVWQRLFELTDGTTINTTATGTNLNVEAEVADGVGSVVFNQDGVDVMTQTSSPLFLGGDTGPDAPNDYNFTTGAHTLVVTPYSQSSAAGQAGTAKTVNFTIATEDPSGTVPSILTTELSEGYVNASSAQTISATGTTPLTYGIKTGSTITPGRSLNTSTGEITGTYTTAGSFTFIIEVSNVHGTVEQEYTQFVGAALTTSITDDPITITGSSASPLVTESGGSGTRSRVLSFSSKPEGSEPTFDDTGTSTTTSAEPAITFDKAGSYTLLVTTTDSVSGAVATDTLVYTVNQTATAVVAIPESLNIILDGTRLFTKELLDQFGNSMAGTLIWSTDIGSFAGDTFTAPSTPGTGTITLTETNSGLTDTVAVTVSETGGRVIKTMFGTFIFEGKITIIE